MDSSGSINWLNSENYNRMKNLVNQFLDFPLFNIDNGDTRVALIYFSDNPNVEFTLDRYSRKTDVQNAVLRTPYLGFKTDTSAALNLARSVFQPPGDRPDVANVILILTDGESTSDPPDTIQVAQSLRVDNFINIYTMGITTNVKEEEIRSMSGSRGTANPGVLGQDYFLSPTFDFDPQLVNSISGTICRDVIFPTPPPPTPPPATPPPIGTLFGRCRRRRSMLPEKGREGKGQGKKRTMSKK